MRKQAYCQSMSVAAALLVAAVSLPARAQVAATAGPLLLAADRSEEQPPATTVAEQRADVAQRLRLAQRALPDSDARESAPQPTSREVELLKQKDLVLQQQEAAEDRRLELQRERVEAKAQLDQLHQNGPDAERPYSFLLLESLNDSLAAEQDRLEARAAASKASSEALERARDVADAAGKTRRRLAERARVNQDPAKAGEIALELKLATLESELADELVKLRTAELDNERYEEETKKLESELLEETVAAVEKDVRFSQKDLDKQQIALDELQKNIESDLDSNASGQRYLEEQLSAARRELDKSADSTPAVRTEVEAREMARGLRAEQARMLNDQLQWLGPMRQTWQRRYALASGDFTTGELEEWQESVEGLIDGLSYERRQIDARIDGLRSNLAGIDRRLKDTSDDEDAVRRWLRDQQRTLRSAIEFYTDSYIRLDAATRLHEKLDSEIERRISRFSLGEWLAYYWQKVVELWNYELYDSKESPITVGKVVLGALLLFLGFAISKRLSRLFGRRVLPRLGVQEGAAHALGSLTFYALATCATLLALRLVNVPLTVFTFFGGAIAIGVGFGAQRPINNFLSGLILLTERPVRVGDMIQLGTVTGIIESIGTRSTRVRTETNLEIIVPNSALLESNVSNWTLSDPTIRTQVTVGVMYGSPTDQVIEIMRTVAEQHIRVLDAPEAFVLFNAFGDNSLEFELHFFLVFRNVTEQKRIQSELRLEIERRFREAGITVAFPQRDVHLDTLKPLEIRVARTPLEARRSA